MQRKSHIGFGLLLLGASLVQACGGDPSSAPDLRASPGSTAQVPVSEFTARAIWLENDNGSTISIRTARGTGEVGARMMELFIETSRPVALSRHAAGDAARHAQKKVVVQQQDEQHLRVIVFASDNVTELDDGVLATFEIEPRAEGPLTLEILTERPIFAPSGANDGLTIGEPLIL